MLSRLKSFHRAEGITVGIVLMLVGMFLFMLNDALGKWLVQDYAVGQLMLLRSVAALVALSPLIYGVGLRRVLTVANPGLQVTRLLVIIVEVAAYYWAVRTLPLADITTFYMAVPLFVTALSVPLLGERVGPRRWAAVVVGFGGVLLILQPTSAALSLPASVALLGALLFSLVMIVTRRLREADGTQLIVWQTVAVLVAGAATVPFGWVPPGPVDFVLLCSLGFAATVAYMCVNRSLKLAPAAAVVPYQYTTIVWAAILGFVVFGEIPGLPVVVGATIIIASGLYVFHREQVLARRAREATSFER